jgi:hypothetical protein
LPEFAELLENLAGKKVYSLVFTLRSAVWNCG